MTVMWPSHERYTAVTLVITRAAVARAHHGFAPRTRPSPLPPPWAWQARALIEEHIRLTAAQSHAASSPEARLKERRKHWASELSEVLQGLALARLVHNKDRSEDTEIARLLKESLSLREELRANAQIAETLNSLGSLRQKQRTFKDAEAYYLKSMELRERIKVGAECPESA